MGDDLDILLKGHPGRKRARSRVPGLKVADILTMPSDQQSLVNWLMRHYEAAPQIIANHLKQDVEQVQKSLQALVDQGFLKTIEKNGAVYYRVKLAPKSGRQMPKDVWQVLDSNLQKANVFISYSRPNKEFVQELHSALEATSREVWVDWENIPVAVDWWQEIQLGIELADTFVFVLSPDSVASKVCRQEIEEAIKHNKRLVPVVYQDVDPSQVHPELSRLNWIFLRPQDDFEKGFKGLLEALDQDLEYVRTHTRLLVRALEWDRNGRDNSYLLRGADLERANHYLVQGKKQEPRPTALHHQYVLASTELESSVRDSELEQQRQVLAEQQRWLKLVTAVSVLAVAMGITSWGLLRQSQYAQKAAEQARIRALTQSSQALFLSDQRFEALITATNAGQLFQNLDPEQQTADLRSQVMGALQQTLFWVQERNRLEGHTGTVWQVAFSPDGQKLASVSADGTIRLWGLDGEIL
ncbi:MAG: TIR domain-containing protein, partial [Leptolyngbya sp. SIO1D8]|nr:TIR domain-containing protein [Leptolyngbya sp. SIO1D8]